MSFDTLQVNTLQQATKPVWEIFDWIGTDTSGVVAYAHKTVGGVDYNNPNINDTDERIIGSQFSFGTGDDISGHFGCVYYGNHEDESGGNVQFDFNSTNKGLFQAKVDGIYKISYHFAVQNVHDNGDIIPLIQFIEKTTSMKYYVIQGSNAQRQDDEKVVISGTIVRRLWEGNYFLFRVSQHNNIFRLELSADEGYTSSGFTVTRL